MRELRVVLMVAVAMAVGTGVARADAVFYFQYGGDGIEGGVMLTTLPTAIAGEYQVTAVSGDFLIGNFGSPLTYSITGLLPVGGYQGNDNLVFYPGPNGWFDASGVSWKLEDGSFQNVSSFFDQGVNYNLTTNFLNPVLGGSYGGLLDPVWFTEETSTTATPEPGTIGLVGSGVLGVVRMVRRRISGGVR